ncbi:hypothetical protein [Lacipirellula parvula]|jgi:hypothetical protein|uniref:Uncharacterized protein n=1 Tax=Lacipirellula parvula TaxID=2650471 RepID=A0A5K7XA73_9BACT|nr:hypothetical protein [Lacipirellula parvula]BBO31641.1 hypothetical protein PLANPX_1253 [Lacipirellula parvula]
MQLKIYVPRTIEIPTEYLPALAKRALDSLGEGGADAQATRGHLVRQAVMDGLLRELDVLRLDETTVDLFCDPQGEAPLEIDNRSLSMNELIDSLSAPKAPTATKRPEAVDRLRGKEERIIPIRRAA